MYKNWKISRKPFLSAASGGFGVAWSILGQSSSSASCPPPSPGRGKWRAGKKSIRDELINGNWKRDLPYVKSSFSVKERLKIIWEKKNPLQHHHEAFEWKTLVLLPRWAGRGKAPLAPDPAAGAALLSPCLGEASCSATKPTCPASPACSPGFPSAREMVLLGQRGPGGPRPRAQAPRGCRCGAGVPALPAVPLLPSFPSFHQSSHSLGLVESKSF